jgi:hypothetical protein
LSPVGYQTGSNVDLGLILGRCRIFEAEVGLSQEDPVGSQVGLG